MLQKNWQNSEAVNWLLTDFKNAYDSARGQVLHNILMQFGHPYTYNTR